MSEVSSAIISDKQLVGPVLSGKAAEDRALWNLSLILVEIAERTQTSAVKTKPQPQAHVEDKVIGNTN